MKKRLISLLLTLSMVFSMVPMLGISANAASTLSISQPSTDFISKSEFTYIRWNSVSGAAGYRITIVDGNNTDKLYTSERNLWVGNTTKYSISSILDDISNYPMLKIWVGAMDSSAANANVISSDIAWTTLAEAPDITNDGDSNITSDGVTLKMTVKKNYGSAIEDAGFYIGTSSDIDDADKFSFKKYGPSNVVNSGTMTMNITGLEVDTKYYYWAYAENGVDETTSSRKYFWTDECSHNKGTYLSAAWQEINPLDDTYHENIICYHERCEVCYEIVEEEAETDRTTEKHVFDAAGICVGADKRSGCGYAKDCKHTKTTKEYYDNSSYPKYECIDENQHEITYRYYYTCNTCGEKIDGDRYFEHETESHTFRNDVCKYCGYEREEELTATVTINKTNAVVGESIGISTTATGGAGGYSYTYYVYENGTEVNSSWLAEETYGYTTVNAGEVYFKVVVTDANGKSVTVSSDVIQVTAAEPEKPEVVDIQIFTPAENEWIERLDPPALTWTKVDSAVGYWVALYDASGKWLSTTKCESNNMSLVDMLPTASSGYSVEIYARDIDGNDVGYGTSEFYTAAEKPIVATGNASILSDDSVELTMSIIRNGGSAITESGFYLGYSANNLSQKYPLSGTSSKGTYTKVVENLASDTTYYYQAYAVNGVNEGRGAVYAFTTDGESMQLTVSPDELVFSGNAESDTISVNSEGEWEVRVTNGADWITTSREYGYLNKNVTVSVEENTTGKVRYGTIIIEDETGSAPVDVQQNGDVDSVLSVNTRNISVDSGKNVVDNIQISSNDGWKVTSQASWILPSVGSGKFDDSISLTVQENTTESARSGNVVITCGDITHTINVSQKAPSRPVLSGFVSDYTVTVNDKFNIQGLVSAVDDGKLDRITIKYVETDQVLLSVLADDAETYDLGKIAPFDTAAQPINNIPGIYTFVIYASADNFTIAKNEIGRFTVQVKEIPKEDAKVSLFTTSSTATSLTVKGKIDTLGSYSFEECGVILYDASKEIIETKTFSSYPKNNSGIFTAQFNGLTAGTTYYYTCYLTAGGRIYNAFSGYKSLTTNDAEIQGIGLEVNHAYLASDDMIYANTGEQFTVIVTQYPDHAVVEDYELTLTPSSNTQIVQGRSTLIQINESGRYTLSIKLVGDDGLAFTKDVTIQTDTENINLVCIHQNDYYKNNGELTNKEFILKPVYRGGYFAGSSYGGYNNELAKMALGLCVSGFTANEHDPNFNYGDLDLAGANNYAEIIANAKNNAITENDFNDYNDRISNIFSTYVQLGIANENMNFYNYEESLNSAANNVAFSIAKKYANINGEQAVILFVVLRGGGYGCEWASNFEVGTGSYSKAFQEAASDVYLTLLDYIADLKPSDKKNLKVLITGYSRAAATSNIVASSLTASVDSSALTSINLDPEDIFCYGFATPLTVINDVLELKKNSYGEGFFDNIHNVINPGDVVPMVPMNHDADKNSGWEFMRFGKVHYFPSGNFTVKVNSYGEPVKLKSKDVYERVDAAFSKIHNGKRIVDSQKNVNLRDELEHLLDVGIDLVGTRSNYVNGFEKAIYSFLHASMSEYGTDYRGFARNVLGKTEEQINRALLVGKEYADLYHNNIVKISWIFDFKIGELLYTLAPDIKWMCTLIYLKYGHAPLDSINSSIVDFVNDITKRSKLLFESCPQLSLSLKESAENIIAGAAETVVGYLELFMSTSGLLTSHEPSLYAAWLYSFTQAEMCALFDEVYKPVLTVACPVNVYFYDESGDIAASVIGDTIINNTEDIEIILTDDVKTIKFPDDTYRIEIVPIANGNMNVSIANVDNLGTEVQKQFFNNVTLNTSLEYELIRTRDADGIVVYQLLDSYNSAVSDESSIKGDIQTIRTQIEVVGNGTAVCKEYVSPGTYVTLTAVPEREEAFIGWYIGSELISTSEIYSFFAEESQMFTAKFTINATIISSESETTQLGDVNMDGEVTMADATLLLQHVAKITTISDLQALANAEVTGDDMLTMADATRILQYVAKIIGSLN